MNENGAHVGLQVDAVLVESEGADAGRRGGADAGQRRELLHAVGPDAVELLDHGLGAAVKRERPPVVPHALPGLQHLCLRGLGKRLHAGKAFEPVGPATLHAHDLRLLEHDLADPHEVRVVDASPGKLAPQRRGQRAHARLECLHTLDEQGFHAKGTAEAVGGVFGCLHIACGRQSHLRYFHSRISQPSLLAWQRSMTSGFTAWAVWAIWSMGASVWWSP